MHIERRELYVSFWYERLGGGVHALLIGWDDGLHPMVAYDFGIYQVTGRFQVHTDAEDARLTANRRSEP